MAKINANKIDLLEHFYEHLAEEDWLKGLELYQTGRVRDVSEFKNLISGKISDPSNLGAEVRLRLHPTANVIQWIECGCKKNRAHGYYCEHIAAFMIHVDQEVTEWLDKGIKAPLKPPPMPKMRQKARLATQTEKKPLEEKSNRASQSILTHLQESIISAEFSNKSGDLKVFFEIKPGTTSHYNLSIDDSARFIGSSPKLTGTQATNANRLVLGKNECELGTRISITDVEKITAERVIAIKIPPRAKPLADLENPDSAWRVFGTTRSTKSGKYYFIPMKTHARHIGEEFFFLPNYGYLPLDKKTVRSEWYEKPLLQTFKDDDAAKLVQSGFSEFVSLGPIFVDEGLKAPQIISDPQIKHVEIIGEEDGWFYIDPHYGEGDSTISMAELMLQSRDKKRRFFKKGDAWFQIPEFITQNDWALDKSQTHVRVDNLGLMRLKAAVGDFDRFVGKKRILQKIRSTIEFDENIEVPNLKNSNLNLRGYQQDGLRWFWWLYQNHLHGLLADDMGLGKTHQAMAIMTAIQNQEASEGKPEARFLVICPTSVLDHWSDRVNEFAPNLNSIVYHGARRMANINQLPKEQHTLITSYGVLLRDIKKLEEQKWSAVILDEAHYVKNNDTATYKAACRLNSRIRLCLTGTPLENHLGELKSLFDFLVPGYLGSNEYFRKQFWMPIEQEKDRETELRLQQLIYPLKLRRKKEQVLDDLPAKIEDLRHCSLSPDQVKLYRDILDQRARPMISQLTDETKPVRYLHVFAILQLLKQVCDHPSLLKPGASYDQYESGKFELLKELLREALDSGNKIVIFSQYLGMIDLIRRYLLDQGIGCVILSGQTKKRGRAIAAFQTDPNIKVFVGSLLAGGIGIDLTAASVVIHYDRWWNATKENQATDRVHRIGQKRYVQVIKLVTKGTLEEKIDKIIQKKQRIFNKFLEKDEELFKTMTRQDLIDLLQ